MKEFKTIISEISVADFFSKSKDDQAKIAAAERNKAPKSASLSDLSKVPKEKRQQYLDNFRQMNQSKSKMTYTSTDKDVAELMSMLKKPIDWTYQYSDDHSVWKKTQDRLDNIRVMYSRLSPEHKMKVAPAMRKFGFKNV